MAETKELALARLAPSEAAAVEAFLKALKAHFPGQIVRVVLFGSKARGDSQLESDIDVLIIVQREDWQLSNAISTLAARISLEYDTLLGPVVIGGERWERMEREKFSLPRNVAREGLVLEEG